MAATSRRPSKQGLDRVRALIDRALADRPSYGEFVVRLKAAGMGVRLNVASTGHVSGITDDHHLTARIEADLEDDARRPLLVIDGKEFTWDQVGHMLMTFEGFTVDMTVRDTIEVVGGPLSEQPKPKQRRRSA